MKEIRSILFFVILAMTIACSPGKTSPGSSVEKGGSVMLYEHKWNLEELHGKPVVQSGNRKAHLVFSTGEENKVIGNGGCNSIAGSFELAADSIKFSSFITTKMACPNMGTESEFLGALRNTNKWEIIKNQLILKNGETILARLTSAAIE